MGQVYLARSPGGGMVAPKVIREEITGHREAPARFRREVATVRAVRSSPHTAQLVDASLREPPYWPATEYVPGPTLRQAVSQEGAFTPTACRGLFEAFAVALADVHAYGVTHRDLKPQNVILAAEGTRLIDFGIARGLDDTALTRTGAAPGTPGFTAPEVLPRNETSAAADVFAPDATMAYVTTGRPPFGDGPAEAVSYRAVYEDIDLAGAADSDPGPLALIRDCVAKDPADRPAVSEVVARCAAPADPPLPPTRADPRRPGRHRRPGPKPAPGAGAPPTRRMGRGGPGPGAGGRGGCGGHRRLAGMEGGRRERRHPQGCQRRADAVGHTRTGRSLPVPRAHRGRRSRPTGGVRRRGPLGPLEGPEAGAVGRPGVRPARRGRPVRRFHLDLGPVPLRRLLGRGGLALHERGDPSHGDRREAARRNGIRPHHAPAAGRPGREDPGVSPGLPRNSARDVEVGRLDGGRLPYRDRRPDHVETLRLYGLPRGPLRRLTPSVTHPVSWCRRTTSRATCHRSCRLRRGVPGHAGGLRRFGPGR
ncbi:serine/threonine protein kinase [Streptomyces sp. R302]|nr:serine/threonine protein kinase [Streptomyces sp. R301]NML80577.1 serine/threonine protein kinase [Streptomyces sp. R302]